MYKPVMEIISETIMDNLDSLVMKAVHEIGVEVDKEELIRALKYDRDQYEKGFRDGVASVQEWIPASEPPAPGDNPVLGDLFGMACPMWYHANTQEWESYGGMRETPRQWTKMPQPPKGVE